MHQKHHGGEETVATKRENKTLKDSIAELVEKEKNKKHFINPIYKEKLERFFVWLFVIAVFVGGIFELIWFYKHNGIRSILLLVVLFTPISLYTVFYHLLSKRNRLIFTLLSTLIYIALGCYFYFSIPTPEEFFSQVLEEMNKNNQ